MNSKVETSGTSLDSVKLVAVVLLLLAGVAAFYWFADQMLLLRVIGMLVVVAVALGITATTAVGHRSMGFLRDARTEVRKVVWPTRQETVQTTLAVVVLVIIVGILLWLLDMFLLWAVRLLTGHGG